MTEAAAYRMLGWSPNGGSPNPFVLPATGSESDDWYVVYCHPCHWSGISVHSLLNEGCPSCKQPWSYYER
jgi:hypothetical protein